MKLKQDKEEFHKNDKVYFVANLIVALAVALMWYFLFYSDSFLVFLFFVTVGWILLIAAGFLLILSCVKKYRGRKYILALHGLIICWFFYAFINHRGQAFLMEENYELHKAEMHELVNYTRSAIKDSCYFRVEYSEGDIFDSELPDSAMMAKCDVTNEELNHIIELIKQSGCMGISVYGNNDGSICLLYRREGLGAYYYCLRMPYTDDAIWEEYYSDLGYTSTYYNDSVIFYYGAGAIGSWNFPRLDEYEKERPEIARRNQELKNKKRL